MKRERVILLTCRSQSSRWHVLPCLACVFPEMHFSFPCLEHFRMCNSQYQQLCVSILYIFCRKRSSFTLPHKFPLPYDICLAAGAPTRIGKKGRRGVMVIERVQKLGIAVVIHAMFLLNNCRFHLGYPSQCVFSTFYKGEWLVNAHLRWLPPHGIWRRSTSETTEYKRGHLKPH